jgi:magnesium chelatase family protein
MGVGRVLSVTLVGVRGHLVEVEADLSQGLPALIITGLPDVALGEARDRLRAAIGNSRLSWPSGRVTIGLSPAWLPKQGSGLDLAMAAAVLCASGGVPAAALDGAVLLGELALDGRVRGIRGILPAMLAAGRSGICRAYVPAANVSEARLVPEAEIVGVETLTRLVMLLRGDSPDAEPEDPGTPADPATGPGLTATGPGLTGAGPGLPAGGATDGRPPPDLADVLGQDLGRRAVEVAAAGGHHVALGGPPGSGKTMLAERLPGVLPLLDTEAALEVTAVHSVAGALPPGGPLIRRPPYQAPHHTASVAALVGGGSGVARPGAVSLAHRGVLFLDEAPEFASGVLDALRQPLERGEVVLARSGGVTSYPARVQLVLAANPCPCSSSSAGDACVCSPTLRRRYLARISGPLLDRVDLRVTLLPVRLSALMDDGVGVEGSAIVAERVARARGAAAERWRAHGWRTNSEAPGAALRGRYRLPRSVRAALDRALDSRAMSARGYDRVLRVAWTLADLGGRTWPDATDLGEATDFRLGRAA